MKSQTRTVEYYININGHPFHLVGPSLWPFTGAAGALTATCGAVMFLHDYCFGWFTFTLGLYNISMTMFGWWSDVICEGVYEGNHTREVQRGLRLGMALFIASETMFFFSLFWAFFHSSLNPSIEIICWPPLGIKVISPWGIPLANTMLLVSSGFTVTWTHHAIKTGSYETTRRALYLTFLLGVSFIFLQRKEYYDASFDISDGIYGSCFYLTTGFHGFHVIIGTIFLWVCLERLDNYEFSREVHVGLDCAVWYWHFVDVVWVFLFFTVYVWGG